MKKITFNNSYVSKDSLKYIKSTLASKKISGDGYYGKKCEKIIQKKLKTSNPILLTTSCTHALEMCAILLNIKKNDEVIVPAYTFSSTALAFYMHGAKIVFTDIRNDTLNIDESLLEKQINTKTKAILVVHYGGVACEMDKIMNIAKKNNLIVIEDNAHGFLGKYKGKPLGTIGHLATLSFHETKNISCGEGGALIINNSKFYERSLIIREKGTDRSKFIRGHVNKYTWIDKGSSYAISDILATLLYSQLKQTRLIQSKRKKIWEKYYKELGEWAESNKYFLPVIPNKIDSAYHLFFIILKSKKDRYNFISYLARYNIRSTFHYQALDTTPMGKKIKLGRQKFCYNANLCSERIIRLPLYPDLSNKDQNFVIEKIKNYPI